MNPGTKSSPSGRFHAVWRIQSLALASLLALAAVLVMPVRGKEDKVAAVPPHSQIVLHTDLKTVGTLATIPFKDAIQSCMGNVEGYPVADKRMICPYFHHRAEGKGCL